MHYISAFDYPFYGVQWHPEKNNFFWETDEFINHTLSAVKLSQYMANFFVQQSECSYYLSDLKYLYNIVTFVCHLYCIKYVKIKHIIISSDHIVILDIKGALVEVTLGCMFLADFSVNFKSIFKQLASPLCKTYGNNPHFLS